MTTECSSTPEAISGILLAGDAVLNLSQQPLNCVANTRFLSAEGPSLRISTSPCSVHWRTDLAHSLSEVSNNTVDRVVVVSESDNDAAESVIRALRGANVAHVHCTLMNDCDADAFMDEEDAEAVAERLRQLGYI